MSAMRKHPVSVHGSFCEVTVRKESQRVWIASAEYRGEMIEKKGSSELSALSRWQVAALTKKPKREDER